MTRKNPRHPFAGEEITGLPEGMAFFRPAQERLPELGSDWCVINIQIEHFKYFTDWFGLEASRDLLSRIGEMIRSAALQAGGMPGQPGLEEFCLIVPYDEDWIHGLFEEFQSLIASVSRLDGFSPVFGVAHFDGSSTEIMEYYNRAALAAESLHGKAHTRVSLYDAKLHRKSSEEYKILFEFQNSLNRGEITFFLQPQVRASNGKIIGAESLARWQRRDGSFISPAVFVPVLEKYGLVTQLDLHIWEAVCRWQRQMKQSGKPLIPVSVNVSQLDIAALDVPAQLSSLLKKYELSADCMKVEITESAYADDLGQVRDTITRLQECGFKVLMDDFGSGYSSLNMLRNVNVDVIKLDAQFLQISENSAKKGVNILESVINMTKNLFIPIIVEGVETEEQLEFLEGLGCRYMQGYYFYRPMPPQDFENLIGDGAIVDPAGIRFKANQQLTVREFMDDNIFTDTMLNNVLGPVVFYRWDSEENVDIIRFNEQFYELVGIDPDFFEQRRYHIQDSLYPGDRNVFLRLLAEAEEHWAIGLRGVVRAYRPNGAVVWISLRLFYMYDDSRGKVFYGSAQDVTETQVINMEMPGAYYRCNVTDRFEFFYISRNFQKMTGYSEREIRILFDNSLIQMVHPADVLSMREQARQLANGEIENIQPFRIRRKQGDYIYLAEQSQISDRFGALCWQCMAIDVSEVMRLRNQMRILSDHLSSTVLFLHRRGEQLIYEVTIHGLEDRFLMNAKELEDALNDGDFCRMIEGSKGIPHQEYTRLFVGENAGKRKWLRFQRRDGKTIRISAAVDRVEDTQTRIEYIVVLRVLDDTDTEVPVGEE